MEEQKQKFNWTRLLITTLIVLVAAGTVGGTTYYVLSSNFQKANDANEKALNDIKKQLQDKIAKSTSEKPTSTNQAVATTKKEVVPAYANDWYKFTSPNYGFTFRYPKIAMDMQNQAQKACGYPLLVTDEMKYFTGGTNLIGAWYYGNFFSMDVFPTNGESLAQFIASKDPNTVHSYSSVSITGAKEAVKISETLSKPVQGYPPLAYWQYILSDGKNFYVVLSNQGPNDMDYCIPADLESTRDQIVNTFNFYN